MHGLIFETSVCYWQNQPGCYLEGHQSGRIPTKSEYSRRRACAHHAVVLFFVFDDVSENHIPLSEVSSRLSPTNSLLPSLSSILKHEGGIMHFQRAAFTAPPIRIEIAAWFKSRKITVVINTGSERKRFWHDLRTLR